MGINSHNKWIKTGFPAYDTFGFSLYDDGTNEWTKFLLTRIFHVWCRGGLSVYAAGFPPPVKWSFEKGGGLPEV